MKIIHIQLSKTSHRQILVPQSQKWKHQSEENKEIKFFQNSLTSLTPKIVRKPTVFMTHAIQYCYKFSLFSLKLQLPGTFLWIHDEGYTFEVSIRWTRICQKLPMTLSRCQWHHYSVFFDQIKYWPVIFNILTDQSLQYNIKTINFADSR